MKQPPANARKRRIILYTACSLNGLIARPNGEVDWLDAVPNPEGSDYGFGEFYASVDITVQGSNTYEKVLSWGVDFPYPDKTNYVLTRQSGREDMEYVRFIREDPVAFVRRLQVSEGGDIWIVGGGQVNTLFLNAGLIDEMYLFIMPVVLPDGIPLFAPDTAEIYLRLLNTITHGSGVVELHYGT